MNFAEDEVPANKANLYSIVYRLQTAKRSETKIKRIKLIIDMLARGEKFHGLPRPVLRGTAIRHFRVHDRLS